MASPHDKPYTVYHSGDAPPQSPPPPSGWERYNGGGRPPRRRGGGLLVVVIVVLIIAAVFVGVAAAAGWGPFGAGKDKVAEKGAAAQSPAAPTTGASASASATPSSTPAAAPSFTVTAGGDVIGGFGVSGVVASMGSSLFKSIAPYFKASDFGFVNLESPLTRAGDPQGWKDVVIKGNPALAPAMAKSGIDVVTMANNHAGDQGDSGLLDSIRYCKDAGITVVGAGTNLKKAQAGAVLTKDGATVAFLGFSDVLPVGYPATATSPGTSPGRADLSAVKRAIQAAAKKADYVVVGWHWNFEYKRAPTYLESTEGKAAIDSGADIVFAHHPHLLDGVQAYHGGLICYSLGNLVFSGFAGETAQTMLVKTKVTQRSILAQLIPVTISGSGVPTVAHGSTAVSILQRVKGFSAALGTTVQIRGEKGYVHVQRDKGGA